MITLNIKRVLVAFMTVGPIILTSCSSNQEFNEAKECKVVVGDIEFTHAMNDADKYITENEGIITFSAKAHTDYFRDPDGTVLDNAPILLKEIDNTKPFTFQALLTPGFTETGTYNAAALYVFSSPLLWQKFAFEQDERGIHRVVTVRTIETSDDNNHEAITDSDSVWFKISSDGGRIACYYSPDGETWQMVRLYKNNYPEKLSIGISSQGPGEDACISQFKKLSLTYGSVGNFRLGE